jgi:hypothetical protein
MLLEMTDALWLAVFRDRELRLLESVYRVAMGVQDSDILDNDVGVDADGRSSRSLA